MRRIYLHADIARELLQAAKEGQPRLSCSLDLNRTEGEVALVPEGALMPDGTLLSTATLQKIAKKQARIFLLRQGVPEPLEDRSEGYVKLVPTPGAPLLEISGVKMHISKGIDPYESASQMAACVVRPGDRVLDCCSGLGYAAIAAMKLGAAKVTTVELNPAVRALRELNPWSAELSHEVIEQVAADAADAVEALPPRSIDAIVHDPPRFSLAGELYSEDFYRRLFEVLAPGGSLFHYTGNPHRVRQGSSFVEGVGKRLKAAGFRRVTPVPRLMGLYGKKN